MPTNTKEPKLSDKENKRIALAVENAKLDILEDREADSSIKDYYAKEGRKRYRCIVTSTRKGEKSFELMIENPNNLEKPVRINGKLGVEITEGLPQSAIDRLENAFDLTAEDTAPDPNPNIYSQNNFVQGKMPRYNVKVLGEVENPKPLGSKRKPA